MGDCFSITTKNPSISITLQSSILLFPANGLLKRNLSSQLAYHSPSFQSHFRKKNVDCPRVTILICSSLLRPGGWLYNYFASLYWYWWRVASQGDQVKFVPRMLCSVANLAFIKGSVRCPRTCSYFRPRCMSSSKKGSTQVDPITVNFSFVTCEIPTT